jgi:HD-like signal output (HDOD) protein
LHDIGKYCLALTLKDEYKSIIKKAMKNERPLYKEEKINLSITYVDVNRWLAEKWHLPASLSYPMIYHNQPEKVGNKYPLETYVIYLASEMSRAGNFGLAGDYFEVNIKLKTSLFPQINEDIIKETGEELEEFLSNAKSYLSEFNVYS